MHLYFLFFLFIYFNIIHNINQFKNNEFFVYSTLLQNMKNFLFLIINLHIMPYFFNIVDKTTLICYYIDNKVIK